MDNVGLIIWLVVGALAGWLAAGRLAKNMMRGGGLGFYGKIIIGFIGAVIGSGLLGVFISAFGLGGSIITAVIGAVVLLFVIGFFVKRR